jgi:3,4-dihydroxy 2-butanone 4-phosphate synthase/GTP cyclohydrolase II
MATVSAFDSIEAAIKAVKKGQFVILVDDEDRENEGDLVMAAEKVTPQAINFMAKHARGLICLALTPERVDELQLPPQTHENTASFGTAFTVSIDARHDITTGISAADRATTIRTAIDPKTKPSDLARPGHIFPLKAQKGGVLRRAGQTEGSVDLARLAGLYPAGVICEIMNDDGTMARVPELVHFAKRHRLRMITIKALIEYRMRRETFIKRITNAKLPTVFGDFETVVFENEIDGGTHIALIKGSVDGSVPTLVRVHSGCLTADVFGSLRCDGDDSKRGAGRAALSQPGRARHRALEQDTRV